MDGKTEKSGIGRLKAHMQIDTEKLCHIGIKNLIFAPEWHKMEVKRAVVLYQNTNADIIQLPEKAFRKDAGTI